MRRRIVDATATGVPEHGTTRRYGRGCRCLPCKTANAQAARERRARDPQLVDAAVVVDHLRSLRQLGHRRIAQLAGLSASQVALIRSGKATRIRRFTADCLLGVQYKPAPGALVSAWRTRKLLSALRGEGIKRPTVARLTQRPPHALKCSGDHVRIATACAVETVYKNVMRVDYDWRRNRVLTGDEHDL